MRVDLFDFDLPAERIALRPAKPRDNARLLVVRPDALHDRTVRDLPGELQRGDVLVFNDTKVIPARLSGRRGAAKVEVTLHQAAGADCWRAFAKPARKCRPGDRLEFDGGLSARVEARGEGGEVELRFDRAGEDLARAIHASGAMPLPPYIAGKRAPDAADAADYQTVYAAREGAVAAPTAGLHFTPDLIEALDAAGIARATLTLHVGAGTFLPVKAEDTAEHRMHAEWGEITPATARQINDARSAGGRLVPVGTTSLRLLESAAGGDGEIRPFSGETDIFITPGYRFRATDLLLTNFHLPRSTLFMLVCAFSGIERMKAAYAHAIGEGYRFYSYGDACLLHPAGTA